MGGAVKKNIFQILLAGAVIGFFMMGADRILGRHVSSEGGGDGTA